ncbi:unnamed protein product (macronuclear) [Paramecium tetraurelia]|uniref:Uncharacterized protein n=1 Tax=Paramecium tetraurelia TaxID=5888 RepID=A0D771_PARTE|nr:uncharacterized protein GSPATT00001929001 [Paramecium tetraurelia]CAK78888.1 unnamed protein product [Paramecium tetraurelia]|eukprot:XP_001446285.1 hypothetical protein (macronuclear) [Paramecium tetraurelia strain d4-2]
MGTYPSCFCCPQSYSNGQQDTINDNEMHVTFFKQPLFNQAVQINQDDDASLLEIMATYEQLIIRKSISTSFHCSSNIRSRSISADNKQQMNKESIKNAKHFKRRKLLYNRSLSANQLINNGSKQSHATYKPTSILKKRSYTQESQLQKRFKNNKVSFLPFILQCNTKI